MINPSLLKTGLVCFLIVFSASTLIAQTIERKENYSNFNGIAVSSGIDLYLTQSANEQIVISGTKELVDRVKVSKGSDGLLKFEMEKRSGWFSWSWGDDNYVKAYVSFKTLNRLLASGGSDVYGKDQIKLNNLNIKSSGGSDVKLDLIVNNLVLSSSGGSDVYLKGKANKFSLNTSGGSDVKAFNLLADDVFAQMSGGSDVELYTLKTISINASGASDVSYKGPGIKKSIKSSGASDVQQIK
jgi:Putative auto-transporter adhesin, head GIN domain